MAGGGMAAWGNEGLRPRSQTARRRPGGPHSQRRSLLLPPLGGKWQHREPEHPSGADLAVPQSLNYTISLGMGKSRG